MTTAEPQTQSPKKAANIYFIGIVGAIAGLLFGFDTGVISGAQEFLFETFGVSQGNVGTNALHGFVVSAVPLGALFGAMFSGLFARNLGRRKTLMLTALLFLLGTLFAALAPKLASVVLGRLLMGLAIGISAMVAPMYLSEVSPPRVRGTIIFLFQLAITVGLLGAFAVNLWFAEAVADHTTNWRFMFAVGIIPALLLFFGMYFMPSSPRWLMLKGQKDKAKNVMQYLLGKDDVSSELEDIEAGLKEKTGGFSELLKKPILPLVLVAFGLFVFQQLSGINAIMYYGPQVFQEAGFGDSAKFWAQLLMGGTNVIATLFGVWVVDKLGRRILLFIGFTGMIICLGSLSLCLSSAAMSPFVSLASILMFVVFFAISLGGVPYIMMSEVFPLRVRGSGMAIASCANWGFNMLVSFSFTILVGLMGGMGNVFALYAVCTMVGLVFAWWFVPETKCRELEDIESNLRSGKSLRNLGDPVS